MTYQPFFNSLQVDYRNTLKCFLYLRKKNIKKNIKIQNNKSKNDYLVSVPVVNSHQKENPFYHAPKSQVSTEETTRG